MTGIHAEGKVMKARAASLIVPLSVAHRSVPKFMKRMKVPDYKEKSVFGVPLIVHVQRCGFPLPPCLQQALNHLRTHCLDQVGDVLQGRRSPPPSLISSFMFILRWDCSESPE